LKYGHGELDFFIGEVWELATQAIVTPVTTELHPVAGIGANVVSRAGQAVHQALAEKAPIGLGHAVITKGGNLASKWLIHISICTLAKAPQGIDVSDAIDEALDICHLQAITSVGIPLVAIEPGELPVKAVSNIIARACLRCLKNSKYPERIVIVVPSKYVENVFREAIDDILYRF
jgi:O-acetyl-ADP-ribose deacetylase (regulator of RNase III)